MDPLTQQQIDNLVAEAVCRLRAEFDPIAIYFFGSMAEGRAGRDSDLDLLVVVRDSGEDVVTRGARAYRALSGLGVPKDVLVYTQAEFETRSARPVTFEGTVRHRGRVVYAA